MAAIIWYAGGIALLSKGSLLIKQAYAIDTESIWAVIAALVGIGVGLIKGRVLFSRSCKMNIERIQTIVDPSFWQCFRPRMLIFLATMISAGAWMSRAAAGNYVFLCLVGALDDNVNNVCHLSFPAFSLQAISFALFTSSVVFWKK